MHSMTARRGILAVLLACSFAAPAAAQEPPLATPAPPTHPVKSPGNADWAPTVDAARTRATEQKKLVYYEIESPNCGECARMKSLLYPAFDFEALLAGMVPVLLDITSHDGQQLSELYGIKEAPSVAIATPSGRLIFLMQGFKNQADFFGHVRKSLDTYRAWAKTIDAQNVGTLSAQEAYTSARQLFARLDYAEARPRYKRAAAAPDATPAIRDSALEGLAAAELKLGKPADARKTIDQLIASTKNPEMQERAELFRASLCLEQNQYAEALAFYQRFAREHPNSQYIEQVRGFIARLEPEPPQ